jgi:hypothetical protein
LVLLKTITQIDQINDPTLRRVISQRFNEPFDPDIDGYGILIEPGDTPEDLESEVGLPLFVGTPIEWIEEHPGCFELTLIPDVGDFGISIYLPKDSGIDPRFFELCS